MSATHILPLSDRKKKAFGTFSESKKSLKLRLVDEESKPEPRSKPRKKYSKFLRCEGDPDGAIEKVPDQLRFYGLSAAAWKPLVGYEARDLPPREDGKRNIRSVYVKIEEAYKYEYWRLRDAGTHIAGIILDVDGIVGEEPSDDISGHEIVQRGLLELGENLAPNVIIQTPRGAHLHWYLSDPVMKGEGARPEPLRFLKSVERDFAAIFGADPHFTGLGRNPLHEFNDTRFIREGGYSLGELAEVVSIDYRPPVGSKRATSPGMSLRVALSRTFGYERNSGMSVRGGADRFVKKEGLKLSEERIAEIVLGVERDIAERRELGQWHSEAYLESRRERGRAGGRKSKRKPMQNSARTLKPWGQMGIGKTKYYSLKKLGLIVPEQSLFEMCEPDKQYIVPTPSYKGKVMRVGPLGSPVPTTDSSKVKSQSSKLKFSEVRFTDAAVAQRLSNARAREAGCPKIRASDAWALRRHEEAFAEWDRGLGGQIARLIEKHGDTLFAKAG